MKIKLIKIWEAVSISFWFLPVIILSIAIALAFFSVNIDANHEIRLKGILRYLTTGGSEGARAVLSSIASSMMTIAGIIFSITIVTLTLASSQLGPRVIRNFIKSKLNQVVLGTYVATFVYCLLVLRTVTNDSKIEFIPNISLIVAMSLALANIILLIIFIHHISALIQADNVISSLSSELEEKINVLFPEEIGKNKEDSPGQQSWRKSGNNGLTTETVLPVRKSNYLNSIAGDRMFHIATKDNLVIQFDFRPGEFLVKNTAFIHVHSDGPLAPEIKEKIYSCCHLGTQRSPTQDSAFIISQIVEIAVRALSPGINDPFTAITCIDRLAATIGDLSKRTFPPGCRYDDEGKLRVKTKAITFEDLADAAFNQIRQYGQKNADILIRLMEGLSAIANLVEDPTQKDVISRHATMITRAGQTEILEVNDKEKLNEKYLQVLSRLERKEM